jgi:hypothetical protein
MYLVRGDALEDHARRRNHGQAAVLYLLLLL